MRLERKIETNQTLRHGLPPSSSWSHVIASMEKREAERTLRIIMPERGEPSGSLKRVLRLFFGNNGKRFDEEVRIMEKSRSALTPTVERAASEGREQCDDSDCQVKAIMPEVPDGESWFSLEPEPEEVVFTCTAKDCCIKGLLRASESLERELTASQHRTKELIKRVAE